MLSIDEKLCKRCVNDRQGTNRYCIFEKSLWYSLQFYCMSLMNRLTKKQRSPLIATLPILLLFIIIFGKTENRVHLKGQIQALLTNDQNVLEKVYNKMDDELKEQIAFVNMSRSMINIYQEAIEDYPVYETEITLLASHLARWYGGELLIWKERGKSSISAFGLGENELPNVDELPYFGTCQDLAPIGKILCSEQNIHRFIYDHVRLPESVDNGGVTVEVTVNEKGNITYLEAIASSDVAESLKREAIRVVSLMSDWEPAKRSGIAVEHTFYLPIIFDAQLLPSVQMQDINLKQWKVSDVPEPIQLSLPTTNISLSNLLSDYHLADSNWQRGAYAVLFSRVARQFFRTNETADDRELSNYIQAVAKAKGIDVTIVVNQNNEVIDMKIEVVEKPEPSYADEDKIYADLLTIMEDYDPYMSEAAEMAIEDMLGEMMWDFIKRFPDHVNMAQAALQHACNLNDVETHTVRIEAMAAEVKVNLMR